MDPPRGQRWLAPSLLPFDTAAAAGIMAVGALGVSHVGVAAALPAVVALACGAVGVATASPSRRPVVPAVAAQVGQLGWIFLGLLSLPAIAPTMEQAIDVLAAVIVEVVVLVCGLTWLIVRPGLGAVILLALYQLTAAGFNVQALLHATPSGPAWGALVVQLLWRGLALAFLVAALARRSRSLAEKPMG